MTKQKFGSRTPQQPEGYCETEIVALESITRGWYDFYTAHTVHMSTRTMIEASVEQQGRYKLEYENDPPQSPAPQGPRIFSSTLPARKLRQRLAGWLDRAGVIHSDLRMTLAGIIPGEVWAALIAVAGTASVAWITHGLTVKAAADAARRLEGREAKRFREQRLWEARKQAYSAILQHLRAWEQAREQIDDGYHGENADPHAFHESARLTQLSAEGSEAFQAAGAAFDESRILISKNFADRFGLLRNQLAQIEWAGPPSWASESAQIASAGYYSLLSIAQAELSD